jgi:adiponectin receptor
MFDIYSNPAKFSSQEDIFVMIGYLFCATFTMLFSSLYHTFRSQNEEYYHWFLSCDLRGILIMLLGCNMICAHFELRCFRKERLIIFFCILLCFVSLAIWVSKMVRERLTKQRTVYFAIFSWFGFIAWLYRYYHTNGQNSNTLWPMGYSYLSIATALVVRALRFPEKAFPYTFDIFGASHQIFHSIVVYSGWVLVDGYRQLLNDGKLEC